MSPAIAPSSTGAAEIDIPVEFGLHELVARLGVVTGPGLVAAAPRRRHAGAVEILLGDRENSPEDRVAPGIWTSVGTVSAAKTEAQISQPAKRPGSARNRFIVLPPNEQPGFALFGSERDRGGWKLP